MLCHKVDNPEASDAELEERAKVIISEHQIDEADYADFQISIDNSPEDADRIAYAIIGRMSELCAFDALE
jgi:hypothetical protein